MDDRRTCYYAYGLLWSVADNCFCRIGNGARSYDIFLYPAQKGALMADTKTAEQVILALQFLHFRIHFLLYSQ